MINFGGDIDVVDGQQVRIILTEDRYVLEIASYKIYKDKWFGPWITKKRWSPYRNGGRYTFETIDSAKNHLQVKLFSEYHERVGPLVVWKEPS